MKHSAAPAAALLALAALAAAACDRGPDPAEQAALDAARAVADSAERALAPVPLLDANGRRDLRRHLNATHVASARELGVGAIRDSAQVAALLRAGRLVPLEDSTGWWIVRELDLSLPYVTPDARAMLVEIGERFHARLDSLGVPRYRFEISSVLRTGALQADLRQGNPNASRTTSSHEFGTTVDIAYNRFSPPAPSAPAMRSVARTVAAVDDDPDVRRRALARAADALGEVAVDRAGELKGVLGEVLREMQAEGRLRALHERAQPVYHITVATGYGSTARPGAE